MEPWGWESATSVNYLPGEGIKPRLGEQTLRNLERSTCQLHNRVSGGAGFEETQEIARRIGMLLNDADMWGRRIMTSAWMEDEGAAGRLPA